MHKFTYGGVDYERCGCSAPTYYVSSIIGQISCLNCLNCNTQLKTLPASRVTAAQALKELEVLENKYFNFTSRMLYGESCSHEWKDYVGLVQRFTYCTKCDEKKDA